MVLSGPRSLEIGRSINDYTDMVVKLTDKEDNPLPDVQVEVEVERIITSTSLSTTGPVCDSDYRLNIIGTIEYFRLYEVCKVVMESYTGITDNYGAYKFVNF